MLNQDGGETLNGTKDGSVNDDGSAETGLECMLMPHELVFVILIGKELLRREHLLGLLFALVGSVGSLLLSSSLGLILQVEADGLLEVDLDRTTLVLSLEGVINLHVDLWAVEGTVTMVESPRLTECVKCFFKSSFSLVPKFIGSEPILRARGQLELHLESEDTVHMHEEVKGVVNFLGNLVGSAENVSIILLEATNTN